MIFTCKTFFIKILKDNLNNKMYRVNIIKYTINFTPCISDAMLCLRIRATKVKMSLLSLIKTTNISPKTKKQKQKQQQQKKNGTKSSTELCIIQVGQKCHRF
jgi:hypothetical protein